MTIISVLGLVGAAALGVLLVLAPFFRPDAEAPAPSLSDRINAACSPPYVVADWAVGSEFDPLPPGVIKVTCMDPKTFDTRVVAVTR